MKTLAPILLSILIASLAQAEPASSGRAVISAGGRTAAIGNGIRSGGSSITVFKYRDKKGIPSFSDAKPVDSAYEVLTYGCFACNVNSSVDWYTTRLHGEYGDHIRVAADAYAVDPALVRAVIHAESGFNPMARSGKGAVGLMQLMPGTARDMGVSNSYEAGQNIMGGARYLSYLLGELKGDISLATAAYNAGLGNVTKYQGIPPFAETQAYVKRVRILYERYKSQNLAKL